MPTNIKCPNCGHEFTLDEVMSDEMVKHISVEKEKLRSEMTAYKQQKENELNGKLNELEMQKNAIEVMATKRASEEFAARLKMLEKERDQKAMQLQEMQKKELDLLREKNDLEQKQKNFEMELEKRLLERRKEIEETTIRREQELFDMKMKEKDVQMDQMKKMVEELRRKSVQGSMQVQGEAQELMLEEVLQEHFPFDRIQEVAKGSEGADCVQTIYNTSGKECGRIIYESKRTRTWSNSWIGKLKNDMRQQNADVAILVTSAFPKDMDRFGPKEGIWICSFSEITGLSSAIREGLLKVYEAQKNQENRGDKMQMLYEYISGNEFKQQIEAVTEAFRFMHESINKERIQMEKIWKEREKQLQKALVNTVHVYGSMKGILGASIANIPQLDAGESGDTADK